MRYFLIFILGFSFLACNPKLKNQSIVFNKEEGVVRQDLNQHWTFSELGEAEWLDASVPGLVHLDLLSNEKIEDPYYGNNEQKQRWIENKNWVYKTHFTVNDKLALTNHLQLVFEGLDTYASVLLNGQEILDANNMFRSWKVDVRELVVRGQNSLEVIFESPINRNKVVVKEYPYTLPSGNETADIEHKVYSFTRKAAYHFGWDWGPRFVSSGIWKPVYLEGWNSGKILDVYNQTLSIEDGKALMRCEVEVDVNESGFYKLKIDDKIIRKDFETGKQKITYEYEINDPQLWWTNGLGEAHLYEMTVSLLKSNTVLDQKSIKYGVRTIELINEKDSIGTSFYFKLNGQPVFMKGGNYIPQDLFLPRVSDSQYKTLMLSIKEANMNMIRVWGGGIYESDLFYDLCDHHGILVWQDFMFAGSMYPHFKDFHSNIKEEVKENIRRLRHHPSIAVWCGNNEIEVAWKNWGWQNQHGYSTRDSIKLWNNYLKIFEEMIPNQLKELDPLRAYTKTSPLSNWGTAANFNHSSMHYWGVWHGRDQFEKFNDNVGRFMVEYGFQSFPSFEVLEKVIPSDQLNLESETMKNRQKSYIGNGLILTHVEQYFDTPQNFEEFVSLSQKTQGIGMQIAIQSHMNNQPHCMGSLFWQLNDCWPGPSWSVIDYYGNKKDAYFTVQEEFGKD